jgi:hypothetical protein
MLPELVMAVVVIALDRRVLDGAVHPLNLPIGPGMPRRSRSLGVFPLLFAHHVNHLDPTQDQASRCRGLQPEPWPRSAPDGAMVLLNLV